MLKKAGIIVAGSAAALLALSPLAFAGTTDHDWDGAHHGRHHASRVSDTDTDTNTKVNSVSQSSGNGGLIGLNALNNVNVCPSIANGLTLNALAGILGSARGGDNESDATCVNDSGVSQFLK